MNPIPSISFSQMDTHDLGGLIPHSTKLCKTQYPTQRVRNCILLVCFLLLCCTRGLPRLQQWEQIWTPEFWGNVNSFLRWFLLEGYWMSIVMLRQLREPCVLSNVPAWLKFPSEHGLSEICEIWLFSLLQPLPFLPQLSWDDCNTWFHRKTIELSYFFLLFPYSSSTVTQLLQRFGLTSCSPFFSTSLPLILYQLQKSVVLFMV